MQTTFAHRALLTLDVLQCLRPADIKANIASLWTHMDVISSTAGSQPPHFIENILIATLGELTEEDLFHLQEIYHLSNCIYLSKFNALYDGMIKKKLRTSSCLQLKIITLISNISAERFLISLQFTYEHLLKEYFLKKSFTELLAANNSCITQICSKNLFSEKIKLIKKELLPQDHFIINTLLKKGLELFQAPQKKAVLNLDMIDAILLSEDESLKKTLKNGLIDFSLLSIFCNDLPTYRQLISKLYNSSQKVLAESVLRTTFTKKVNFFERNLGRLNTEQQVTELLAWYEILEVEVSAYHSLFFKKYAQPLFIWCFCVTPHQISAIRELPLNPGHRAELMIEIFNILSEQNNEPIFWDDMLDLAFEYGAVYVLGVDFIKRVYQRKKEVELRCLLERAAEGNEIIAPAQTEPFEFTDFIKKLSDYDSVSKQHDWYYHSNRNLFVTIQTNIIRLCKNDSDFSEWFVHLAPSIRPYWLKFYFTRYNNKVMQELDNESPLIISLKNCVQNLTEEHLISLLKEDFLKSSTVLILLIRLGLSCDLFHKVKKSLSPAQEKSIDANMIANIRALSSKTDSLTSEWLKYIFLQYVNDIEKLIKSPMIAHVFMPALTVLSATELEQAFKIDMQKKGNSVYRLLNFVEPVKLIGIVKELSIDELVDLYCCVCNCQQKSDQAFTQLAQAFSEVSAEKIFGMISQVQKIASNPSYCSFICFIAALNKKYVTDPRYLREIFPTEKTLFHALRRPDLRDILITAIVDDNNPYLQKLLFAQAEKRVLKACASLQGQEKALSIINSYNKNRGNRCLRSTRAVPISFSINPAETVDVSGSLDSISGGQSFDEYDFTEVLDLLAEDLTQTNAESLIVERASVDITIEVPDSCYADQASIDDDRILEQYVSGSFSPSEPGPERILQSITETENYTVSVSEQFFEFSDELLFDFSESPEALVQYSSASKRLLADVATDEEADTSFSKRVKKT